MRKPRRLLTFAMLPVGALAAFAACNSTESVPGDSSGSPPCVAPACQNPEDFKQQVVISEVPPPPISGGTLTITDDGSTAIVSDPDRDRIIVVDLDTRQIRGTIPTKASSEPGRSVVGVGGVAYVVLRRGGQIDSVDLATGSLLDATDVCRAPRGIAFDGATGRLHVACASGELVTYSTTKARSASDLGKLTRERTVRLGEDLRDVVVSGDSLLVSHFRSAVVEVIDSTGKPIRQAGPVAREIGTSFFTPTVAWRMLGMPDGSAFVVHQQSRIDPLLFVDSAPLAGGTTSSSGSGSGTGFGPPGQSGYGGSVCGDVPVHAQVTQLGPDGVPTGPAGAGSLAGMPLVVDIAVSKPAYDIAVLSAATHHVYEASIYTLPTTDGCVEGFPIEAALGPDDTALSDLPNTRTLPTSREPIALAYGKERSLVVQIREPSMLEIHDRVTGSIAVRIGLGGPSRADTAHAMFHSSPDGDPLAMSCASCHPEGREDGHVWTFQDGPRRTNSLAAFSTETAPFHWQGDIADVSTLVDDIYTGRMGAGHQSSARKDALAKWLQSIPPAPSALVTDTASAARGAALFADASVGCTTCHTGDRLTNNATVDVGTGGPFQVPSLQGIAARAPFMHDGCAPTLTDRFTAPCGGGDAHGHTSQLSQGEIGDLVSYLKTL